MSQSVYSFQGSHLHIRMDDKLAANYNSAVDAFFRAQKVFEQIHGRKVTPTEVMQGELLIRATDAEYKAWNKVARFVNDQLKKGLELTEEECTSEYLVKIR